MGETDDPSFIDRIRSWARHHASDANPLSRGTNHRLDPTLPLSNQQSLSSASTQQKDAALQNTFPDSNNEKNRNYDEEATVDKVGDNISSANPPPAPPPSKVTADAAEGPAEVEQGGQQKLSIPTRMKNGCFRFYNHTKDALTRSWINVLLIFVPAGIAVKAAGLNASVVFAMNAVAIIPLAGVLTHATESVASRLGDAWGALLNVSFGNAVELIIFIIALVKNEIQIVQASLLGSILANLLLILGMAFLFGGLRFREQVSIDTKNN